MLGPLTLACFGEGLGALPRTGAQGGVEEPPLADPKTGLANETGREAWTQSFAGPEATREPWVCRGNRPVPEPVGPAVANTSECVELNSRGVEPARADGRQILQEEIVPLPHMLGTHAVGWGGHPVHQGDETEG